MKQEDVQTATSIAEEITEAVKTGNLYLEGYEDGLKDGEEFYVDGLNEGFDKGRVQALRETKEDLENISVDLDLLNQDYDMIAEELSSLRDASTNARNKNLAIGFGVGVTTGVAVGLLAFLRERKVKQHIIGMIEDMVFVFEKEAESNGIPVTLDALCYKASELMLHQRVRSFKNPFGISKKESIYVSGLLLAIAKSTEQLTLQAADPIIANPEDIEAQVKTTPVK